MVVRDLNVEIADPEGNQQCKEIAAALVDVGLDGMYCHFLLCRTPREHGGRTWRMLRDRVQGVMWKNSSI